MEKILGPIILLVLGGVGASAVWWLLGNRGGVNRLGKFLDASQAGNRTATTNATNTSVYVDAAAKRLSKGVDLIDGSRGKLDESQARVGAAIEGLGRATEQLNAALGSISEIRKRAGNVENSDGSK